MAARFMDSAEPMEAPAVDEREEEEILNEALDKMHIGQEDLRKNLRNVALPSRTLASLKALAPKDVAIKKKMLVRSPARKFRYTFLDNSLQLIDKIVQKVIMLNLNRDLGKPLKNVKEIGTLSEMIDVGLENLDVCAKNATRVLKQSDLNEKVKFMNALIEDLTIRFSQTPDIEKLTNDPVGEEEEEEDIQGSAAQHGEAVGVDPPEDEDDDDEEEEEEEDDAPPPAELTIDERTRIQHYARVIIEVQTTRVAIQDLVDEMFASNDKLSNTRYEKLCLTDSRLQLDNLLYDYSSPYFGASSVENFRNAIRKDFSKKDLDKFKSALFNQYYGRIYGMPVPRSWIAHDYTYCIAWVGMWLRMKDDVIERNEAQALKRRNDLAAAANLFSSSDVIERELPDDLYDNRQRQKAERKQKGVGVEGVDEACLICLVPLVPQKQVVTNTCQHFMCLDCILALLALRSKNKLECPACRGRIMCYMMRSVYDDAKRALLESGALTKKIDSRYDAYVLTQRQMAVSTAEGAHNPNMPRPQGSSS